MRGRGQRIRKSQCLAVQGDQEEKKKKRITIPINKGIKKITIQDTIIKITNKAVTIIITIILIMKKSKDHYKKTHI